MLDARTLSLAFLSSPAPASSASAPAGGPPLSTSGVGLAAIRGGTADPAPSSPAAPSMANASFADDGLTAHLSVAPSSGHAETVLTASPDTTGAGPDPAASPTVGPDSPIQAAAVPEPTALALLLTVASFAAVRRALRRSKVGGR